MDVRNGDLVEISLEPRHLLKASFVVYGYPMLGAVFAAVIARGFSMNDVTAAMAALAGLVLGILIARIRLAKTQCLREFTPTIVERLGPAPGT